MYLRLNQIYEVLSAGKSLILIDDSKLPYQSSMICLAELAGPDMINLMIKQAKGMLSVVMSPEDGKKVGLSLQVSRNHASGLPVRNYTVSIDAIETTTGISAFDRSLTIKKLAGTVQSQGFRQPGHIFPVLAEKGGLYRKISLIEACQDLVRILGHSGMIVSHDILDSNGDFGTEEYMLNLGRSLSIPVIKISGLVDQMIFADGLLSSRKEKRIMLNREIIRFFCYEVNEIQYVVAVKQQKRKSIEGQLSAILELVKENKFPKAYFIKSSMLEFLEEDRNGNGIMILDSGAGEHPEYLKQQIYKHILNDLVAHFQVITHLTAMPST